MVLSMKSIYNELTVNNKRADKGVFIQNWFQVSMIYDVQSIKN